MEYPIVNAGETLIGVETRRMYQLISMLGSGTTGSTWLAHKVRDLDLDDPGNIPAQRDEFVAVKICGTYDGKSLGKAELTYLKAFHNQSVMGLIDHAILYQSASDDWNAIPTEYVCLIMPLYGKSIYDEYIASDKRITQKHWIALMNHMMSALNYIHSIGVAHWDIKPENILSYNLGSETIELIGDFCDRYGLPFDRAVFETESFVYVLCDFGNSFHVPSRKPPCTPSYHCPESLVAGQCGQNMDYWQLGLVLLEVLNGTQLISKPYLKGSQDLDLSRILEIYLCLEERETKEERERAVFYVLSRGPRGMVDLFLQCKNIRRYLRGKSIYKGHTLRHYIRLAIIENPNVSECTLFPRIVYNYLSKLFSLKARERCVKVAKF